MRALVQRADGASVSIHGEVVGAFEGPGLVVFVGSRTVTTRPWPNAWRTRSGVRDCSTCKPVARRLCASGRPSRTLRVGSGIAAAGDQPVHALRQHGQGRRPTWDAAAPRVWLNRSWTGSWKRCGKQGPRSRPAGSVPICRCASPTTDRSRCCSKSERQCSEVACMDRWSPPHKLVTRPRLGSCAETESPMEQVAHTVSLYRCSGEPRPAYCLRTAPPSRCPAGGPRSPRQSRAAVVVALRAADRLTAGYSVCL